MCHVVTESRPFSSWKPSVALCGSFVRRTLSSRVKTSCVKSRPCRNFLSVSPHPLLCLPGRQTAKIPTLKLTVRPPQFHCALLPPSRSCCIGRLSSMLPLRKLLIYLPHGRVARMVAKVNLGCRKGRRLHTRCGRDDKRESVLANGSEAWSNVPTIFRSSLSNFLVHDYMILFLRLPWFPRTVF